MNLERIHYKIYKLLPILIPVALLIVAIILILVGQIKGNRDRPVEQQPHTNVSTETIQVETIPADQIASLPQHLKENCVLVEVTRIDNWNSTEWYETYFDYLSNAFEQYKITLSNNEKQYAKLTNICRFSGQLDEVKTVLDTLPTDCKDVQFDMLDTNMYGVSNLTDGYIWIAKQKEEGKTLNTVKITATYMDVYFKDSGNQKRAVITDRYILVDDYIGEVPTY